MAEPKKYNDANQFCKNKGARLFEPRSKTMNKLIYDKSVEVFGGRYRTWLGINNFNTQGVYVFASNGEKISTRIWASGQPNTRNKRCVDFSYNQADQEKWYDRNCLYENYFICEFVQ